MQVPSAKASAEQYFYHSPLGNGSNRIHLSMAAIHPVMILTGEFEHSTLAVHRVPIMEQNLSPVDGNVGNVVVWDRLESKSSRNIP
jgi:hypothetical protein